MSEEKSAFEEVATNEKTLFTWRIVVLVASAYISFVATKILHVNDDLKDQIIQLKYDVGMRMSTLDGEARVLNSRLDSLSIRATNADSRMDGMNARLIELIKSK